MSSELGRLASSFGVPEAFTKWLGDQGLRTSDDLAMVTSKEDDVDTALVQASGVEFPRLIDRVSVTKLWMHCRSIVDRETGLKAGRVTEDTEEKLDKATTKDIYDTWDKRHAFRPRVGRILSDTLLCRRYKELNADPRRLTIILPEHVKTLASYERKGKGFEAESVDGHDELWCRIRADFSSMSLVTVHTEDFFPYGVCEKFLDQLRVWIFQRFRGKQAPLSFYQDAYNKTMQLFVDGVRTEKKTLRVITEDVSSYKQFWTIYTAPAAAGGDQNQPPAGATADVDKDFQSEIDSLKAKLRAQQSTFDKRLVAMSREQGKKEYRQERSQQGGKGHRSRSPVRKEGKGQKGSKGGDYRRK